MRDDESLFVEAIQLQMLNTVARASQCKWMHRAAFILADHVFQTKRRM